MRVVVQRVSEAKVIVENDTVGEIGKGLLLLLGIEELDGKEDIDWMLRKIVNMRIFRDENNHMNISLKDVKGELLIISQFTLHASTKKGNRPSFIKAAKPEQAESIYQDFIDQAKSLIHQKVATGIFGADMKVSLVNDGPVTIIMDSRNKE